MGFEVFTSSLLALAAVGVGLALSGRKVTGISIALVATGALAAYVVFMLNYVAGDPS